MLLLFPRALSAIELSGIYSSACEREIGIILYVDDTKVKLLTLEGKIKSIKRFDIIYIAYYPMGKIGIPKIEPSESIRITEIKTLYDNRVTPLVRGWMTNYFENKISFLTTEGIETVIDTGDVWDIDFVDQDGTISFKGNGTSRRFHFVHPYPFGSCEEDTDTTNVLKIYPHHLLETPLLIKAELDRLEVGYKELQGYVDEKVFYPKPQLYTNRATLGVWAAANNRYGSSGARNSSFIPVVRNELSEGLYKFQRVIVTGSAPMPFSMHEEPQTQFYYAMKSSYFHLSLMYDLIQFLTSDYKWQADDLTDNDDRQNETMHIAGGFDYGNYAVEYAIVDANYAVRHEGLFHSDHMEMGRVGLFYTHRLLRAALYIGSGDGENEEDREKLVPEDGASQQEIDYINYLNEQLREKPDIDLLFTYYRLNLDFPTPSRLQSHYSLIYKKTEFEREANGDGVGNFIYEGESLTNALFFHYDLTEEDLFINGYISVEMTKNRSGITRFSNESQNNYVKSGISIGLVF